MTTEPEINADCTKLVILRPGEMVWESNDQIGVSRVKLERVNDRLLGRETSLMKTITRSLPSPLPIRRPSQKNGPHLVDNFDRYTAYVLKRPPGGRRIALAEFGSRVGKIAEAPSATP